MVGIAAAWHAPALGCSPPAERIECISTCLHLCVRSLRGVPPHALVVKGSDGLLGARVCRLKRSRRVSEASVAALMSCATQEISDICVALRRSGGRAKSLALRAAFSFRSCFHSSAAFSFSFCSEPRCCGESGLSLTLCARSFLSKAPGDSMAARPDGVVVALPDGAEGAAAVSAAADSASAVSSAARRAGVLAAVAGVGCAE